MMSSLATLKDCGLWRGPPIILASKSWARARLLQNAGVVFDVVDSNLDERNVPNVHALESRAQALHLAREKARIVSRLHPGQVVVGADQTLELAGCTLHKPPAVDQAMAQLRALSGAMHSLHSAVACMQDEGIRFEFVVTARITMRKLTERMINAYAAAMGDRLTATVGGYEIEGLGANLLESVDGDFFTVVGLPMFQLLSGLRQIGLIAEEEAR